MRVPVARGSLQFGARSPRCPVGLVHTERLGFHLQQPSRARCFTAQQLALWLMSRLHARSDAARCWDGVGFVPFSRRCCAACG